MVKLLQGDRIGREGALMLACASVVFDAARERLLLTRRADNGRWCLPGGHMEPGESATEACLRELREETGLEAAIVRLVGVYSSPDWLLDYGSGARFQVVALCFEAVPTGGALALSDETTDVGYFSPEEIVSMDVMDHHRQRIRDAFAARPEPVLS